MFVMSRLQEFRALRWAEKMIIVRSCVLLPLTALGLRIIGLRRCQRLMATLSARSGKSLPPDQIGKAAWLVNAAAYHVPYRASCLERSLVLWFLLRLRGIKSDLRIGVLNRDHGFTAHAWVEIGGVALNDRPDIADTHAPFSRAIDFI